MKIRKCGSTTWSNEEGRDLVTLSDDGRFAIHAWLGGITDSLEEMQCAIDQALDMMACTPTDEPSDE